MLYLLPLTGAIMWGLWFVLAEEGLSHVSVSTWCVAAGFAALCSAALIQASGGAPIDFKPMIASPKVLFLVVFCVILARAADLTIAFSLQHLPAGYVALMEMCYPLFVPLFAYIILGNSQLNAHTVAGGLLIMLGVAFLVYNQATLETKGEVTVHNEQRIVAIMPVYDSQDESILWNGWNVANNPYDGIKQETTMVTVRLAPVYHGATTRFV